MSSVAVAIVVVSCCALLTILLEHALTAFSPQPNISCLMLRPALTDALSSLALRSHSTQRTNMVVWLPLESNPDVINKFLVDLGVSPEYQVGWRVCAGTTSS